jgi:hypothetical protein
MVCFTQENTPEAYTKYASRYYGKKQQTTRFEEIQADINRIEQEYRREANNLITMMANYVMGQKNIHVQQQKTKLQEEAALFDMLLRQIEADRKAILGTKTKPVSVWNKEAHHKKMKELFAY